MGRMSIETRMRVVVMWNRGYSLRKIQMKLQEENIQVSIVSLCKLTKKFRQTNSVLDQRTYKPPRILTEKHLRYIDKAMADNPELTGTQLTDLLKDHFPATKVSKSTVKRVRRELGWISKKTRYCALISDVNRLKHVEWCKERQRRNDLEFSDVIWTDKCTVQLESHRKRYFHKEGQPPRLTGKPKHPPKVNLWGGISHKGASTLVIFTGTLTATRYTDILDAALVPHLNSQFSNGHRFLQDNDPKHTSRWSQEYFEEKRINWFKTPASSPDLNPIENVWGSLKEYLRSRIRPRTVAELKYGIRRFWKKLTPTVCKKYISHLKKVIPRVVEVNGDPSGY